MATVSSIGTSSRDYSTIDAWVAAFTTGGWEGECYNDSEFVASSTINIEKSTSATDYIELRAASGEGFADSSGKLTNALKYNQSNGVGITGSFAVTGHDYDTSTLRVKCKYVTLRGLQIKNTGGGPALAWLYPGDNANLIQCILQNTGSGGGSNAWQRSTLWYFSLSVINSLLLNLGDGPAMGSDGTSYFGVRSSTLVTPSDVSSTSYAIYGAHANTGPLQNTAVFGFSSFHSSANSVSGNYNATDLSSGPPGANSLFSKTYSSQFEGVTSSSPDYRAKSGGDIIDAGTDDSANISAVDIVGTTRPQGSAWDIGAWEYTAGGGGGGSKIMRLSALGVG